MPKLVDELRLMQLMSEWKKDAGIDTSERIIYFTRVDKYNRLILDVYTQHVGRMIGTAGKRIDIFKSDLKEEIGIDKINIKPIEFHNIV